jgi:hypothetical protein
MHWDSGPKMIDEFVKEHDKPSHCYKNTFCNELDLRNTVFELEGDGEDIDEGPEYCDAGNDQVLNSPIRGALTGAPISCSNGFTIEQILLGALNLDDILN